MATVTLDTVWIHDGGDYSSSVTVDSESLTEKLTGYTKVRRFAGGRLVSINQTGDRGEWGLAATLVTRSDIEFVQGFTNGDPVVVRDPFGRVIFGVVSGSVDVTELPGASTIGRIARARFRIHEITDSPEV